MAMWWAICKLVKSNKVVQKDRRKTRVELLRVQVGTWRLLLLMFEREEEME